MSGAAAGANGAPRAARPALPLESIPRATYRVQLHRGFTFRDVAALAPYLASLGVSHVYCSPYLRARPGSLHGYDIVDHAGFHAEIGTRADFDAMTDALARHGMSHLCDVVPNHMAVERSDNAWWTDVLENGPASAYAGYFDIDWLPQDPALAGRVLLPVLGDPYGDVLERGELRLRFDPASGAFGIRYFDHRLPIDPREYPRILLAAFDAAGRALAGRAASEVRSLAYRFAELPARDEPAPGSIAERRAEVPALKAALAAVVGRHPAFADAIAEQVRRLNGTPGEPGTFDALDRLLDAQAYRLAHWRVASDEINYRRFFDINELAALRMEDEAAFEATHAFILGLAAEGRIGGLRIDHPDGLYDPKRYFARLQARFREEAARRRGVEPGEIPALYVVVEKITAPHERLPDDWPVHGTTGYRFANLVNGLFVDPRARSRMDRAWRGFVGDEARAFDEEAYRGRRAVMQGALASELAAVTLRAHRLARADRRTRDLSYNALREAIMEVVARFPVYRTYVDADGASAHDRQTIAWAVGRARARSRASDARVFDFLHAAMLGAPAAPAAPAMLARYRAFAMRMQQFTSPVAAKGIEDTAFYRFNRLVSLNEVGGDPDVFGTTLATFHGASAERAARWPHTLVATSTHDNKRSEDVRMRIDAVSQMPAAWRLAVRRWARINRSRRTIVDGAPAPSRNDEYLLYQTLAGTFPPDLADDAALAEYRGRIESYMLKAAREAKAHTSWFSPRAAYEQALAAFVAALLRAGPDNLFLAEVRAMATILAWHGSLASVAMTLVKLASPGVPDLYQGNEVVDLSLVDPDNRRPVDYARRASLLAALDAVAREPAASRAAKVRALLDDPSDGRAKLWATARALALRRERPALFAFGDYRRVAASGEHADHVVAFARTHAGAGTVVLVVPRLVQAMGLGVGELPVGDAWGDTAIDLAFLGTTPLVDTLTGATLAAGRLRLADGCRDFPGALLATGGETS